MTNVLFFTDAHVEPDTDLKRFSKLGQWIVQTKPDVIVQGGDFCSFSSLSAWDKDKRKEMEGKRFTEDIKWTHKAIHAMFMPLYLLQKKQRANKEKLYRPKLVWIEGNHEDWVRQYIDRHPSMEGILNLQKAIELPNLFSEVDYVPYNSTNDWGVRHIDGVAFCHAPRNRGGIISSKYLSSRALAENFDGSVIFGHNHRFTVDTIARMGSNGKLKKHMAVSGGCFTEEKPQYTAMNPNDWWPGILFMGVNKGQILNMSAVSLEDM